MAPMEGLGSLLSVTLGVTSVGKKTVMAKIGRYSHQMPGDVLDKPQLARIHQRERALKR